MPSATPTASNTSSARRDESRFPGPERELGRQVGGESPAPGDGSRGERRAVPPRDPARCLAAAPHIVPLLTAGHTDDLVYYTMPLIEGESLRAKLVREGERRFSETIRILKDVVDASRALMRMVSAGHQAGQRPDLSSSRVVTDFECQGA